ncbi:MAG: Gfo/Idh/MocA family oxidoreductase [Tepidisphaeraceae bacterium]
MSNPITRRRFLSTTAATVATASALPALAADAPAPAATAPVKKLNIGIVGVGGRGFDHVREIKPIENARVVALCDVDSGRLANAAGTIEHAAHFVDFRDMLKMSNLDAVVVATPDHTHAVATAAALRAGKHVYCEKPLTHTVREARAIAKLAEATKLVTQLGIQVHSMENYRRVVELVQAGAIGAVREVHIWNNRTNRAVSASEVPPPVSLNYDLWLGPVSQRPFNPDYHPYNWRRWWAFGSGMLGDIGCHLMDVAFWALDLGSPTRVQADGSPRDENITTEWIIAQYDFPARGDHPAVKLTWYDPPKTPPMLSSWNLDPKHAGEGVMFIGDAGMLYTNYTQHALLPAEKFADFKAPAKSIVSSPGHQREWVNACLKNDPRGTTCPFSYGGLLSETALLGTLAFRAGKPLDWDAKSMRFTNAPEADRLLGDEYRAGWVL